MLQSNEAQISKLIEVVKKNERKLKYINLDEKMNYAGWVSNFNIKNRVNENVCLDLNIETDLFLLFVLASAWSRTGSWENAAYFTVYLKLSNNINIDYWRDDLFVEAMLKNNIKSLKEIYKYCNDVESRKKISFRKDYYPSVQVIAHHWCEINAELRHADESGDWIGFAKYLNSIEGLGFGSRKMKIKIPLILRELRTQQIFNIPGEYCCVTDDRVKKAAKDLNIHLPIITDINSIMQASKKIYYHFGDLYDIALFAYEDYKDVIE